MEKKFSYEYNHSGAKNKVEENFNKREKSPKKLRVIEERQKLTKPGNLRFKLDSNLIQK